MKTPGEMNREACSLFRVLHANYQILIAVPGISIYGCLAYSAYVQVVHHSILDAHPRVLLSMAGTCC
jgi:hypothetical protein